MKNYKVGLSYSVAATDEFHAVEQFLKIVKNDETNDCAFDVEDDEEQHYVVNPFIRQIETNGITYYKATVAEMIKIFCDVYTKSSFVFCGDDDTDIFGIIKTLVDLPLDLSYYYKYDKTNKVVLIWQD